MPDNFRFISPVRNSPKLLLALACGLVIAAYSYRALRSSHPQQVNYSNWLNSNFQEEEDFQQLSKTVFTLHFPESLGAVTWELSGSETDQEINRKLKRLMELARSSSVFAEGATRIEPDKIIVTLNSPEKSFSASLTREQIEQVPELQTFFKLFELYTANKRPDPERVANENS